MKPNALTYISMIDRYLGAAFWTLAAITQLASQFGAMSDINLMVWGYGSMVLGLGAFAIEGLYWYGRDQTRDTADASAWTALNTQYT